MSNITALVRSAHRGMANACKYSLIIAAAVLLQPTLATFEAGTASAKTVTGSQCGKASWYALTSRTASGEMADPSKLSAAHRTLPFGTIVKVTNLRNGKAVNVRINDRGPFVKGRVIDVTKAAADKIGFVNAGITSVKVEVIGEGGHKLKGHGCS
ncbi:septal ring lytic transglycosylase RlpA family protein [Pseudovibrio exalbescens]|nr:septal ring lytic transglycosylase RlpA family protein [Pseudovibrio exalbescens]MDD7910228.1 septal ring lytic transglycosylase RlpA family protein [Pseudovibrio exalbescens]